MERSDTPRDLPRDDIWLPDEETPRSVPMPQLPLPPESIVATWEQTERKRRRLAIVLFVATCVSTFLAGMNYGSPAGAIESLLAIVFNPTKIRWAEAIQNGLLFSIPLLAILMAHEGGHWLFARRHRVPATLPFFIPFPPSPFGTMGAVILQDGRLADRRALFDIAIAGPLAGLVLALPIAWIGVSQASLEPFPPGSPIISYGDPLILKAMVWLQKGPLPEGTEPRLNPLLFAGWVGIFITALNLMPIGQLDGGHILYTLIGKRAHKVSQLLLVAGVAMMIYFRSPSYALMTILLFLTGPRHPPTANDNVPLGPLRIALGWLTLAFIVVGFTPVPISMFDVPGGE